MTGRNSPLFDPPHCRVGRTTYLTLNQPRTRGRHPPPPLVSVSFPVSLLRVQSDRTALRYCAGQSPHRLLVHALTGRFLWDRSNRLMLRRPKGPPIFSFALGRRENVVTAHSTLTNTNSTGPKAHRAPILGVMERPSERRVRTPKDPRPERRASARFALTLEARYAISGRRAPVETGSGRTIDLSSSGLSFTADRSLETGQKLDVSIDWPALLDGGVKLQLIVSGVVYLRAVDLGAGQIARTRKNRRAH